MGTPIRAYDEEGNLVWERELDIYGKVKTETRESANFVPFRYQGQYYDSEVDLCYNRFRYYDCNTGTYISQDPISILGGLNLYSYVFDSNGWVDVFGLEGIIQSSSYNFINLTSSNWKNVNFGGTQKGLVYILKDVDTGELLKVGKSEVSTYVGRFSKYVTAGNKLNRNLGLDIFSVDKSSINTVESIEKSIREGLEKMGYSLPWDNTNNRLGRVGPGTPFTRLNKKLRELFEWNNKGELKIKRLH